MNMSLSPAAQKSRCKTGQTNGKVRFNFALLIVFFCLVVSLAVMCPKKFFFFNIVISKMSVWVAVSQPEVA